MRNVTREIRGAYKLMLNGLQYKGVTLPVKNGFLNGTAAHIPLSGGITFDAYVLITNQYRNANQLKNGLNYLSVLTIDINTVFTGDSYNMAGAEWVEEITDIIYDKLFQDEVFKLKEFGINDDRFIITSTSNYSQPLPLQYTDTSRVFRSVVIFENDIHHLHADETQNNLWIKTLDS